MRIDVRADIKDAKKYLESLGERTAKIVIARSLNKTAEQVKNKAVQELKDEASSVHGLSVTGLKRQIVVSKAYKDRLTATIETSGKRIPTRLFKARQTKAGVVYSNKGRRSLIKGAFIATMPSGHKGVFMRTGKTTRAQHKLRKSKGAKSIGTTYRPGLKIKEHTQQGLPQRFGAGRIQKALVSYAGSIWAKVFDHELRFELAKAGIAT